MTRSVLNFCENTVTRIDDAWHHIAVSWEYSTGATRLYFDGEEVKPFWRASEGALDNKSPTDGGVDNKLAPGVERSSIGSFVLGQVYLILIPNTNGAALEHPSSKLSRQGCQSLMLPAYQLT